ncbi:MAG: hypothetical protein E7610_01765 [Ruminococcaceae bacterium]|nr:hypothetical protein [Oscillospiraceae bacterium]
MTRFAYPQCIRRDFTSGLVVTVIMGIIVFFSPKSWVLVPLPLIVFTAVPLILWRNAFSRVTIDENGIRNKYIGFTWDEMEDYKIIEVPIPYRSLIPYKREDIICWGKIPENRSFLCLNPRESVFIAMDKQAKEAMASFSKNQFRV